MCIILGLYLLLNSSCLIDKNNFISWENIQHNLYYLHILVLVFSLFSGSLVEFRRKSCALVNIFHFSIFSSFSFNKFVLKRGLIFCMKGMNFDIPLLDHNTKYSLWLVKMRAMLAQMDLYGALLGFYKIGVNNVRFG